ncbi:MAG TPA: S4 domain-containing protein [Thermoanaerobaculia bacterium]|nr:S4 domain-containing protein [Thermoanaerobaculia bacterium]
MKRDQQDEGATGPGGVRLDVYLDVACLFPTRSQAAAACKGGKVDVNGHAAPPHKLVKAGDSLALTMPSGRRTFVIRALAEHHVPKAVARTLREETTPPPSPEVLEAQRLERLLAPRREEGTGRPSKRERRERERFRGR